MSFWVLDVEACPPRLRGVLSRWGVEVRAGLYVGATSMKTRDAVWKMVEHEVAMETRALLVFPSAKHPMGFDVRTVGRGRREMVDVDGLMLARFLPQETPKSYVGRASEASDDGVQDVVDDAIWARPHDDY